MLTYAQLLSWMLIAMDSKDIEDAFVRQVG
jgi:hypothetical protein